MRNNSCAKMIYDSINENGVNLNDIENYIIGKCTVKNIRGYILFVIRDLIKRNMVKKDDNLYKRILE